MQCFIVFELARKDIAGSAEGEGKVILNGK